MDPVTPEEIKGRNRQIELKNVRLQIEHLMTYPTIKSAVNDGRVHIKGLYNEITTGSLPRVPREQRPNFHFFFALTFPMFDQRIGPALISSVFRIRYLGTCCQEEVTIPG